MRTEDMTHHTYSLIFKLPKSSTVACQSVDLRRVTSCRFRAVGRLVQWPSRRLESISRASRNRNIVDFGGDLSRSLVHDIVLVAIARKYSSVVQFRLRARREGRGQVCSESKNISTANAECLLHYIYLSRGFKLLGSYPSALPPFWDFQLLASAPYSQLKLIQKLLHFET